MSRAEWERLADGFSARLSFRVVREVEVTEDRISVNARARLAAARGSCDRGERVVWRLHLVLDGDRDLTVELGDASGVVVLPGVEVEAERFARKRDAEVAAAERLVDVAATLRSVDAFWDATDGCVSPTVLGLI